MYKSFAAIFVFLASLSLSGAEADVVEAHPVVWQIKTAHGTVTLFGSLHILPANLAWLTPEIEQAVTHANVFVFEVATDPPSRDALNSLIAAHGSLPDGVSLRALLPPDSQSAYDSDIAAAHLSPDITNREQPWLVALQLSLAQTMNRNYFPDAGADYVLMSWANAHRRSVRYLETVDQQFALIRPGENSLTLEDFESGLKSFGQGPNQIEPLITAWSDGDVARLGSLMDASFAAHPDIRKKLLTDRNKNWASQIEQMLGEGGNFFVTVGAAHLAGPDGVPALLRADGYGVTGP